MSNQSGIEVSPRLAKELPSFVESGDRALILHIADEACELEHRIASSSDVPADLEAVASRLEADGVRYLMIRNQDGTFAFGSLVPEGSSVRDKMLYASSSSTIQKQLGSQITSTHFWTSVDDVTGQEFVAVVNALAPKKSDAGATAATEKPLTSEEQQLKDLLHSETSVKAHRQGGLTIAMQLPSEAISALSTGGTNNFVALGLNGETLHMHRHATIERLNVSEQFGADPSYAVFQTDDESYFIFWCPTSTSARKKMIAAAGRNHVLDSVRKCVPVTEVVSNTHSASFLHFPRLHFSTQMTNLD